jgi:S-adenosylmethionine decarboxylase
LFFEGTEKKAEIILTKQSFSLVSDVANITWQNMVQSCNARILSTIENTQCKAFLLSESSLFVWHDRCVILTCGVTRLINAVEFFIQHFSINNIEQITYQRKNEFIASAQLTSFKDDVQHLAQAINGNAYLLGNLDHHHHHVFFARKTPNNKQQLSVYEFLAYNIGSNASKLLNQPNLNTSIIRKYLNLTDLLVGFYLDDFAFSPLGYSLNAIKENFYFTMHITPQETHSYISVEANFNLSMLIPKLLDILNPASYDLLCFNDDNFAATINHPTVNNYVCFAHVAQELQPEHRVSFASFVRTKPVLTPAIKLAIST